MPNGAGISCGASAHDLEILVDPTSGDSSGESQFLPFRELSRIESPFKMTIGGREVVVHYDADAITARVEGDDGVLLESVLAYQLGWFDFFPRALPWAVILVHLQREVPGP